MARIAGVDVPRDKRVVVSLTYIYGVGNTTAKKVLANAGVSEEVRVRDLTNEQVDAIRAEMDKLKVENSENSGAEDIVIEPPKSEEVTVEKITGKGYVGYVMLAPDASKVKLVDGRKSR